MFGMPRLFVITVVFTVILTVHGAERPTVKIVRGERNVSSAVLGGIDHLRAQGGGTLCFEKGEYHFYVSNAVPVSLHVSNHDQVPVHPVFLPLTNLTDVAVDGGGSRFVFHGRGMAALVMDSERVVLRNFSIDWQRPWYTELKILGYENGKTLVWADPQRFPVELRNGRLYEVGEDWSALLGYGTAFCTATGEILEGSSDVSFGGSATAVGDNRYLIGKDLSRVGRGGLQAGDVFLARVRGYPWRPHPGVVVYRAKDTVVEDVVLHAAFGMGILVQRSENFAMRGTRSASDRTCGVFPSAGRSGAHLCDATHFSNVKGKVTVENCWFGNMLDDAINVHSTCLAITNVLSATRIRCRYMHDQAWGFGVFQPGETLRFIRGRTLENGDCVRITAVEEVSEREVELTLAEPLPTGYGVGDAVENADYQCAVDFRNNVVTRNRARGALFTSPRPIRVEGNLFDRVSGAAILLAGDAQGWYESGACEDIRIAGNVFRDNLTSRFQFTEGVISIYPEIKDLAAQKRAYHRNIIIEDNLFETFDVPLLFAKSAEGIRWRHNRVVENAHYTGWGKPRFITVGCRDVRIENGSAGVGELPRAEMDFAETKVREEHREQWESLSPIAVANGGGYVFYASRGRKVRFIGRQSGAVKDGARIMIRGLDSDFSRELPAPGTEAAEIACEVPAKGWYTLRPESAGAFLLERADVAVAIDGSKGPVALEIVGGAASCRFDLPNRRYPFAFALDGEDVAVKVTDYSGAVCFDHQGVAGNVKLIAAEGGAGGLATVTFKATKRFVLDITGLPAYLQLVTDKHWHWNGLHREAAKQLRMPERAKKAWNRAAEAQAMQIPGRNADFVAKVESGEFRRARVSWWGFEPEDSTRFLQAAIDSGAAEIVVDRLETDWIVTPLFIRRDNLTVTFEDGAVVLAKSGAFISRADCLLTISEAKNVTLRGHGVLRMRQADYVEPPYIKGEWRHCLYICRADGVTIDGLRFELSGGDGISTGSGTENLTIRNCICDRNFRQGISICSARNLLIEDCELINTKGTAPAAGIDFEPDHPTLECINNCVMRNCISTNNAGSGVDVCLNNLNATSLPVSLRVENCHFENNSSGATIRYRPTENCATGEVVFSRCAFVREKGCGIGIERSPRKRLRSSSTVARCSTVARLAATPTSVSFRPNGPSGSGTASRSTTWSSGRRRSVRG